MTLLRFLALGDSYTIGEAVDEEHRWPVLLAGALRERGLDVAPPEIVAETGWTTDELSDAIDRTNVEGPFDLVSLLIGVNDQYRKRSPAEYRPAFRALLDRAIAFAGGGPDRVLVLSIPDWSVTPFAGGDDRSRDRIREEIDSFNAVARQETEAAGAYFVDITPVSRAAADDAGLTAADGLHPAGPMYASWAELALPAAARALRP